MSQATRLRADLSKVRFLVRAHQIQERDITNGLIAGFYGVLVVLCVQSIYALMRRRKTQATTIVLSLTILALFTSTTMFVVVTFVYNDASSVQGLLSSAGDLWHFDPPLDIDYPTSAVDLQKDYTSLYQRTGTTAIMINIILGDSIVWWRACVVWNRNLAIWAVCGIFLTATFVLGVLDATLSSGNGSNGSGSVKILSGQVGALFEDNSFGVATCLLSLTANLVATLLIAFKAWKCRMRLRGYLAAKAGGPSQAAKLFSILIESGAVYCAIWVIVVAYQIGIYSYYVSSTESEYYASDTEVKFLYGFGLIMGGALVPLIAIYPTVVIVLVASSTRSHMEQGLTVDVRTSCLIQLEVVADTVTIGRAPGTGLRPRRSDVLLADGPGPRQDSVEDGEEGTGMDTTSEEWKLECAHHGMSNV